MSYAILKHQLLDIEVIIKKTLVFAGLFAMVIGVVSAVTTIIQAILVKFIAVPQTISMTVSILIAMTLYDPTRKFLVNVTDKYLFQKKESFGVILNRLSQEIVTILDISEVAKTILKNLEQTIRLESGALFIKNEKGSEYEIFDSFGLQDTKQKIDKNDALVKYLLTERRLVNLENANVLKTIPFQIHDTLKILKTHECLPLIILDDLIGFLILGKKKSDQDFSQDEIDYFPTLASQIALALRNARAVAIEKRTQLELAQQSKLAALGTLTAGIGHEINNPLNNISGVLGMLLFNLKAGAYDPMGKEELVKEIKEVTQKAMENVHRTSDVIKRLSMFSKKPKDFKTEEVNLEEAIEEALKNVKNQLENNNIMVKKQYWKNPLVVLADFGSIVQSLVAIFINAVHAMGTSGMLTVSTAIRENKVDLMIKDTGSGISKEIQDKIFDPFFTTKDTSRNPDEKATTGSGLGLYVVRLLMNMCGGDIKVESEVGKGTAFILSFPIHKK
ncbi:GAF domain-containing protein [Candidatus Saccharibacteria bacterium]|nr:GAF domain-containing protein [Candidatus Saccharibacteria bacterium]